MTVLVDPLRDYPHAPFRLTRWCHMAGDRSFEELHEFAARLGIPRSRFQGDHYDLPPWLRASAVALGAEEVSTRELLARMAGDRGDRARRRAATSVVTAANPVASEAPPKRDRICGGGH